MRAVRRISLAVGVIGTAFCLVGAWFNAPQFFFSYLFAYVFWTGLALGCLGLLMIHHLTGGEWGFVLRRLLEAGIGTLPQQAVLFLPLFFGLGHLYSWARPGPHDPMLEKKLPYLNTPGFFIRTVIVFGGWIAMAALLRRWSREQDRTTDLAPTRRMRALSGPGLVAFAVLGTLAGVDWVMVLENDWTSTIFPIVMMIGQMLAALSGAIALLVVLTKTPPLRDAVTTDDFHKLGNLLLAFVMLWAYMAVSQLIIIWSGNLPREISWYLHRVAGGWRYVALFIGLFHFGAPFALLLWREAKRRPAVLAWIAGGVFGVHALEVFWEVSPSLHKEGFAVSWIDVAAFVAVGGLWVAGHARGLSQAPLLAVNDPRQEPQIEEAAHA